MAQESQQAAHAINGHRAAAGQHSPARSEPASEGHSSCDPPLTRPLALTLIRTRTPTLTLAPDTRPRCRTP